MKTGLAVGVAGLSLPENAAIVRNAESAGVYALCVGEATYDTFASASYVSSLTAKSRVVSGIATWARPPVTTALAAATVDEISNGRYELGIGTMPEQWSRDFYQIDPARPLLRMREYVGAIRAAWKAHSGATCDVSGDFYTIKGYRRITAPLRDEIPIHLAVTRPGMAQLAGEISDGVLVNWLHTQRWLHETLEPAIARGEAVSGKRVQRAVMVRVLIEPDPVKARALLRPSFAMYQPVPYFHEVAASQGHVARDETDALVDAMTVHGSVDEVIATLDERYGEWADWLEIAPAARLGGDFLRKSYADLMPVLRHFA